MTEQEIYWNEQEYKRAMDIMHKNVMDVTPEELKIVKDYGLIK
tara:strand:+ start:672 stop:800 length:129 start_codon:yes stop_codon:yes gene_type:complete